ncbi:nitrate transporter [Raphidocelis subcapitata]|uniref:Nitrate transporter n=1 Tax=Raphidocelis subcapitata TaxID=307507 RepID=A0A2V0PCU2_9CHLO|nr:nitrate transporter [Raphidocelis subcapitata]|eukprot:GBF96772.1 nitrate transporter [Raphidocelis subcapitata]
MGVAAEPALKQAMYEDVKEFSTPVDSEHKSTRLRIWSFQRPHHAAFQFSWLAFFAAFVSTFAPAALLPVIRDNIDLTKTDLGNAGIAAVVGAIAARVAMGNFVDVYGPRFGISLCVGLTAPAVYCIALCTNAAGFIVSRLFIGFSLATFVACQYWCTSMFTTKLVGSANAFAAGWGNMGGGFTHFVMPLIFSGIMNGGVPSFMAWRYAFFVPASFQVLLCICVLVLCQDMPDGNMTELYAHGSMKKPGGASVWKAAVFNYRTWAMALAYGYCFGVELTVDNVISQYMFDQFRLNLSVAGMLGSVFGMLNLVSRPSGGMISDWAASKWGMRGRLWTLWVIQTLGGVFCIVLGLSSHSLTVTMVILVIFSICCQQSCGLSFGVVPFVSKRSTGLVSGFVGAGGNAGGAVTQAIFFTYATLPMDKAFVWMGVMTIGMTALYLTMYFPQWGGLFAGPKAGVTEEDYYLAEYTPEEISEGLASASIKFAYESRSQRGIKVDAPSGAEAPKHVVASSA